MAVLKKPKSALLAPETLAVFLKRATDLHGKGRLAEATALYEHIEKFNPNELSPQYFLATIDIETGRLDRALERLRKMTRKAPFSFETAFALAFTFEQLGEWPQAVESYGRAFSIKPASTAARFGLAHALEVTGNMEGAIAQYRSMAELPPIRLRVLIGIARIAPSEISKTEVDEMTASATDEALPVGLSIGLMFAVAGILEANKQYDEAFRMFAEGNRLNRLHMAEAADEPADIVIAPPNSRARTERPETAARRHAEAVASRKAAFGRQFIEDHSGQGHGSKAPIFIVGMPRSGSTLVEQILSSHKHVEGLGEVPTLWRVIAEKFLADGSVARAASADHFKRLGDDYLLAQRAYGWRKSPFLVDKMLGNYLNIGMIHLMFPDAVILHCVRDPVETCLACFRQLFRTGNEATYDLRDLGAQYVRYREMMAHWQDVLPASRITDVVHEDLICDPDIRIRWLVEDACKLKWDDNCLRFHQTKRPVRTASIAQVRQPIFRHSLQRWRKYGAHLEPLFEALGPFAPTER